MPVTLEGIIVFLHPITKVLLEVAMMALQPSRLSKVGLSSSITILVRLGHLANEVLLILDTSFEMLTVVRFE